MFSGRREQPATKQFCLMLHQLLGWTMNVRKVAATDTTRHQFRYRSAVFVYEEYDSTRKFLETVTSVSIRVQ